MKKSLFTAMLAAAILFCFTSCKKDSDKNVDRQCYEVTLTTEVEGFEIPVTNYVWASPAEIIVVAETLKAEAEAVNVTYKLANASDAASCTKQLQCWAITTSYGLMSISTYLWGTEAMAKAAVEAAKKTPDLAGATITYAAAYADDQASCNELNKQGF